MTGAGFQTPGSGRRPRGRLAAGLYIFTATTVLRLGDSVLRMVTEKRAMQPMTQKLCLHI